jgi:hypothetical protein
MSHHTWEDDADRQSSAWIDGVGESPGSGSVDDRSGQADDQIQRRVADLLLVNALLANLAGGFDDERELRVRRVMRAVDEAAPSPRRRVRLRGWPSLLAVAACLLVMLGVTVNQFGKNSLADEVLIAVHQASSEAIDRVYAIRRLRPASDEREPTHGRLYLRGRTGFVVTCGDVTLGRNADQFWLVTPDQQVILSDDFDWIDTDWTTDELGLRFVQRLSHDSRHFSLMELPSVARLMQSDYEVTLTRGPPRDRTVDLLVGQRRSTRSELPETIQLWSETKSRVIQRVELRYGSGNAITMAIEPNLTVPADWYSYHAHCGDDPQVRHIPSGA